MIFPCKDYPAYGEPDWCAVLNIRVSNPARHSPPTRLFEVIVDTGASRCLFHASIAPAIGIDLNTGKVEETMGVDGRTSKLYLHRVSIHVAGTIETAIVGFSEVLPLAGLLGRRGFLDRFKFTYDYSTTPPQFEITKIARA